MVLSKGMDSVYRQSRLPILFVVRRYNLLMCVNFLPCLSMMKRMWMVAMLCPLDTDKGTPCLAGRYSSGVKVMNGINKAYGMYARQGGVLGLTTARKAE
jgi:hypothetical protein